MLAPGTPKDRVQIIDSRDLAVFVLDALEKKSMGTYNLVSPPGMFTIGDVVSESIRASKNLIKPPQPAKAVWATAGFLEEQKVQAWSDMPVWVDARGDEASFADTSSERAIKAGLKISPMRTSVVDTLQWHLKRPQDERLKLKAGIDPAREQEVLRAWRGKT